jgi:hypothetical protein
VLIATAPSFRKFVEWMHAHGQDYHRWTYIRYRTQLLMRRDCKLLVIGGYPAGFCGTDLTPVPGLLRQRNITEVYSDDEDAVKELLCATTATAARTPRSSGTAST